jgi:hypothetical protein
LVADVTDPDIRRRSGFVRMMIVTDPAQAWVEPGQGVLFTYAEVADGPCCCQWPVTDLAFAKQHLRRKFKVPARGWRAVPDQLPGCLDDWLGPVRLTRAAEGAAPRWERYEGGRWLAFDGPEVSVVYPPPQRHAEPGAAADGGA